MTAIFRVLEEPDRDVIDDAGIFLSRIHTKLQLDRTLNRQSKPVLFLAWSVVIRVTSTANNREGRQQKKKMVFHPFIDTSAFENNLLRFPFQPFFDN